MDQVSIRTFGKLLSVAIVDISRLVRRKLRDRGRKP
jgi:hypothetical protein